MNTTLILELLRYTIPAIITGGVAAYFFNLHIKNENKRRSYMLRKDKQNVALPIRLQAYERMTLFLERMAPSSLLVRISPSNKDKIDYQKKLANTIEREFEHNLVQQIYVTDACWNVIKTAKNSTLNMIRNKAADGSIEDSKTMRESLLQNTIDKEAPSNIALTFIKNEVSKIF
jgi:hypothetical protein